MKDEIAARLRAIRGRESKATPGPWYDTDQPDGVLQVSFGPLDANGEVDVPHTRVLHGYAACALFPGDMEVYESEDLANAAFIAAARDDVPYLLGVAEAAQAFLGLFLADEGCGVDTCEAALALLRAFGGDPAREYVRQ